MYVCLLRLVYGVLPPDYQLLVVLPKHVTNPPMILTLSYPFFIVRFSEVILLILQVPPLGKILV